MHLEFAEVHFSGLACVGPCRLGCRQAEQGCRLGCRLAGLGCRQPQKGCSWAGWGCIPAGLEDKDGLPYQLRQPRDREEGPQTPGVGRLMGTPGLALAGRLGTVRKGKSELQ